MDFKGGHPTSSHATFGRVKCAVGSRKDVGSISIGVGLVHFHYKDFEDLYSCTVFIHFSSDEAEIVLESSRTRACSVAVEKSSVDKVDQYPPTPLFSRGLPGLLGEPRCKKVGMMVFPWKRQGLLE